MSEKNGIEIDYCPECRGIWLDRGELDKIIERAKATTKITATTAARTATVSSQTEGNTIRVITAKRKRAPC